MKTIEVISLIYKSPSYFDFIAKQFSDYCPNTDQYETSFRFIANNPTQKLLDHARSRTDVKTDVYLSDKESYYINRVYLGYNFGVMTSEADYVCLVNSDDCFSPGWLFNLYKWSSTKPVIAASRLIESGKLKSGQHGIEKYFGNSPENYQESEFIEFSKSISQIDSAVRGGLYMPMLISRDIFLKAGGFPPGNICEDGVGGRGRVLKAGDDFFFHDVLEKKFNLMHITPLDSNVYHFQEGEKDE
jgi:hypothetical protein